MEVTLLHTLVYKHLYSLILTICSVQAHKFVTRVTICILWHSIYKTAIHRSGKELGSGTIFQRSF